ncbi:hypothetical protein ACHAXT_001485 [Thalassiosira profunda]
MVSTPSLALCLLALLALLAATAAASGAGLPPRHLQLPAASVHVHLQNVARALRDGEDVPRRTTNNYADAGRPRREQAVDDTAFGSEECPGTPLLWKIVENASGKHVGFGLGTMHLPVDVVTTDGAYASILAAIEDSCDVFGELNLHDTDVVTEIAACAGNATVDAATVEDIPDPELQEAIRSKMMEIGVTLSPDDPEVAQFYADRLLTLPLEEVQRIILFANTPEYSAEYLDTLLTGTDGFDFLDAHLLSLGRPSDGLEEVSTQCDILEQLNPSAAEIAADLDTYRQTLLASLDADLSREIELYRCGNVDVFVEEIKAGLPTDEFTNDLLLANRNEQMAEEINSVLKSNSDERIMFTVGAAHWTIGTSSLENLLKTYGYTLEHVPEWHSERAENHSNMHCNVMPNVETGFFDPIPEGVTLAPTVTPPEFPNLTNSPTLTPPAGSPTSKPTWDDQWAPEPSGSAALSVSTVVVVAGSLVYLWS